MKIINLIESMLLEATPQEIYNSYYKDIPYDVFSQIVFSDPNTSRSGEEIKKIGKYSKLLLTMYKRGNLKIEDLPKATEYLTYVYKHQLSLDVNKIKTLSDLYDVVKSYYTKDAKDLSTVLKALSPEDYKMVHQDDKWTIFVPLTEKGACYLGINTEWCTAWGPKSLNPNYRDRESRFSYHNQKGYLYIIINNSDFNQKYQFHFETNQYMDINDKRIDTGKFLDENISIRDYFFPSFTKPNLSESEIKEQIGKMQVLSSDSVTDLMDIILKKVAETNPLIKSISDLDEERINELIVDDNLVEPTDIYKNKINFTFDKLSSYLESTENTLSYYESDKYYSGDRIYDDASNWDDDYKRERLEVFFKEYYEENKQTLDSNYGIRDYEQFKSEFFEGFYEDSKIVDEYYDQYIRLNVGAYEDALQTAIDDIEKYISFSKSGYRGLQVVEVNVGYFMLFLANKNITSINGNLEDVLDDYILANDVQQEYEGIYDYNYTEVKYENLKDTIETYFENQFDDYEGVQECTKLRIQLSEIIKKLFGGKLRFENEHVIVQIDNNGKVDCEDGTVDIIYVNKDTNKQFQGAVKVENLPSYVTNYSLFESVFNFKRFI